MKLAAAMLLFALGSPASTSATPGPLPFVSDDFPRARAAAIRSRRPMFVDVWAPW